MSYHKFISESPSATTRVAFLPDTYTPQSIAESIEIPDFIITDALSIDLAKSYFTAVSKERVLNIIQELSTYECGKKQLEILNALCTVNNFKIQFIHPKEQGNRSEYALKVEEATNQFGCQFVLHMNIIYICVDKEPPQSIERNVCIYDKSTGIIEKTKTYIIQDDPIKSDAYKVGHELSHATVFISFLSDIKNCFKQYVELIGTDQSKMFKVQIKNTSKLENEYQKQFLKGVDLSCNGQYFSSLQKCFLDNTRIIFDIWQNKYRENLLSNLKNNFNLKDDKILKTLFFNGEEARNLLGLDESMAFKSSYEIIGEFHYINESYQNSHGSNYNIIRMPYYSKAQWDKITDCDEIIKSIFQQRFNLKDYEIQLITCT